MAAPTLQPSEYEILREVEALRDLRRRSTTQVAINDPDLPNQTSQTSPTAGYWSAASPASSSTQDGQSLSGSYDGSSLSDPTNVDANNYVPNGTPNTPAEDPFRFFWVPASLHPQIAPSKFREFLQEHSRESVDDEVGSLSRSSSSLSTSSLGRRRSMLSRQYRPHENDGVENEDVVPFKRNSRSQHFDAQITIDDLQKFGDDPGKLRSALRRSFSVDASGAAVDRIDGMPAVDDEADAPIIVPPPGQILRRAARTKIRKAGLPGDGNGHRFGSTRRGATSRRTSGRKSNEFSTSDHEELEPGLTPQGRLSFPEDGLTASTDPHSEENFIISAYTSNDDESDKVVTPAILTPPPVLEIEQGEDKPRVDPPPVDTDAHPVTTMVSAPVLHQPQPQRLLVPQIVEVDEGPSRTPSPSAPLKPVTGKVPPLLSPPTQISTSPSPPQFRKEKEKDKKGLFGKWGAEKTAKKGLKDKERESRERANEKEKDSGFFGIGSFFGKKKQESDFPSTLGVNAGREAAQALLGASKSSKAYVPPSSPGLAPGVGSNPYARYPIHVERAIYRLSHIKLANPRRPLYEQVLISNLMFWYLGVINKAQNPTPPAAQIGTIEAAGVPNSAQAQRESEDKEKKDREQTEKETKEQERLALEKEQIEMESKKKQMEMESKKKESGRRVSLTKGPRPTGGRRAEMPIKGPQYEMQHRVMEQEYIGYGGPPQPMVRPLPSIINGPPNQGYPRMQQQSAQYMGNQPKQIPSLVQSPSPDGSFFSADNQQPQQRLPPGAMPPAGISHASTTFASRSAPPSPPLPSANAGRRSHSPPHRYNVQQPASIYGMEASQEMFPTGVMRSLSASAVPLGSPPQRTRKGSSVQASPPIDMGPRAQENRSVLIRPGEEEDVPLAVYQQQRRK